MKSCWAGLLAVCCLWTVAARAEGQQVASAVELADLSLEQLSALEVTSVSGRSESLQQAAASVYVITGQEIRRSGAQSLPQALRLAPNLQVAQTSAGQWAISARGFNDSISNKLLVLIDGRTIYSSLFAGVFWDANDVVLEDVDRIEVISGPGGTLWGANAVNGVINVVTRRARETEGVLVSVTRSGAGGREVARWGTALGENGSMRLYLLAQDRGNTVLPSGAARADESRRDQGGFRSDWNWGVSSLTLQGDLYQGGEQPANNFAPVLRGGNLLGRWSSTFADGSAYKVQASYDDVARDDVTLFRTKARTTDLQFSHEAKVPVGQLLWGAGHRETRDENQPTASILFAPAARTLGWSHLFAQYQRAWAGKLQLTAGTKLERNSYTGLEFLPSLRAAWFHTPTSTTWASVSRAVRAPSRIDRDFFLPGRPPFVIAGGPNFRSEVAHVYELGHRAQVGSDFSWSATLFRQQFSGLRAGVPGQLPATVENLVEGPIDGLEGWAQWQATRHWRLMAGYLNLRQDLRYARGLSPETSSFPGLGNDPHTQWSLRSSHNLGRHGELDLLLRRVGDLRDPQVPGYTAVDAQFALQLTRAMRIAVIGQNLFDPGHVEFNAPASASVIQRRLMLRVTWEQ
ncbi:MAG TPA: TonB-dependent receptor [Ramlibacter sp.]|jgi:iron complex outermembrane receptor protein|uniref:TonB-dependent receptor plug domain-containing protein n=1 Tax=Ramlibacter sp. TaxID=1917967 RepID=UPI002D701A9D|nr:TonB-dependent receptor [Ramlibacter sp.]HZY19335.1 TonB-dependent receptor [Ramlibacter sp.]